MSRKCPSPGLVEAAYIVGGLGGAGMGSLTGAESYWSPEMLARHVGGTVGTHQGGDSGPLGGAFPERRVLLPQVSVGARAVGEPPGPQDGSAVHGGCVGGKAAGILARPLGCCQISS